MAQIISVLSFNLAVTFHRRIASPLIYVMKLGLDLHENNEHMFETFRILRIAQWILGQMCQTSNRMMSLAGSVPKTEEDHLNMDIVPLF